MTAQFTTDNDAEFTLGSWREGHTVLFEESTLRRFVDLATELLAQPRPQDSRAERPKLTSTT
ncbi:MAG: hypothetical protein M3548_15405 [Actinomycetota bacterium]|nr:hypothetical protein [Actinomycetota bacterium]